MLSNQSKFLLIRVISTVVGLSIFLFFFKPVFIPEVKNLTGRAGLICKKCTLGINDLVAIRYAGDSIVTFGRILASPGDSISLNNDYLSVNQVDSSFKPNKKMLQAEQLSPQHFYILLYDNNIETVQDYGKVKAQRIIGKLLKF